MKAARPVVLLLEDQLLMIDHLRTRQTGPPAARDYDLPIDVSCDTQTPAPSSLALVELPKWEGRDKPMEVEWRQMTSFHAVTEIAQGDWRSVTARVQHVPMDRQEWVVARV